MVSMANKIGPLSNVKAIYDKGCGKYPSRIRLAMEDGTIQTFWREVQQPKPVIHKKIDFSKKPITKMDVFDEWAAFNDSPIQMRNYGLFIRGEYVPKHLKKETGGAATPTGK